MFLAKHLHQYLGSKRVLQSSKIKHNRIMTMDEGKKSIVEEKVIVNLSKRPAAVPSTTPKAKALIPKIPKKAAVIPRAKN